MTDAGVHIQTYQQFLDVLRKRFAELGTTLSEVDRVAGIASNYSQKIMGQRPVKRMGVETALLLIETLGLRLEVHHDPEAFERYRSRFAPRKMTHRPGWAELAGPGTSA